MLGSFGNDTIHHYPPTYEGKLTKLLCISKELFEKLRLTAQKFSVKENIFKNTPAQAQKIKSLPKAPAPFLRDSEEARYSVYAPTSIWQTRYSELWQWQRVSEWHHEYGQDEIINEKRHILM